MKSQSRMIIIATTVIIIITGITLGTLLPILLKSNIPSDSELCIFTISENIVFIDVTDFKILTEKTMKIDIFSLLEKFEIKNFNHINIISLIDKTEEFLKNELNDSLLLLNENGFQFKNNNLDINFVQGLAIDFNYFSVDIAPTIYQKLGFTGWDSDGQSISFDNSSGFSKALFILLDGFGWRFWSNLSSLGVVNLDINLLFNQSALTAFPSITNVATASLITGYWPASTGITTRQDHILSVKTIFDVAGENSLVTEIIEGNVGFLDINADYESWLTDLNGENSNDDEIHNETIEALNASRSDLIFVHFHGIDDIGHEYGPYSNEWLSKVNQTFDYVNEIMNYIDNETLVVITADHGMHIDDSSTDYRLGTHGESRWEDMIIPIIFARK